MFICFLRKAGSFLFYRNGNERFLDPLCNQSRNGVHDFDFGSLPTAIPRSRQQKSVGTMSIEPAPCNDGVFCILADMRNNLSVACA
jgi:hypothetical protein